MSAQGDGKQAVYTPFVDEHRFSVREDRIISPRDPRLMLAERQGATFEFHLVRSWADSSSPKLMYCIAYLGGQKRRSEPHPGVPDGRPEAEAEQAEGESDASAPPRRKYPKPYQQRTTLPEHESEGEGSEGGTLAGSWSDEDTGMRFWPRYAFYLSDQFLYFQTGDRLQRCELTQASQTRIGSRQRTHFVVTLRNDRVLVHADGRFCAQFKQVSLASMDGVQLLPDHELDQVVIGARPSARAGRVTLLQEMDGRLGQQAAGFDLDMWLRDFDGKLGGIRFWQRAFGENYVSSQEGQSLLASRGFHDVRCNIAFPKAPDAKQPRYEDLVFHSDFSSSSSARHRLRIQQPLSGRWVNSGIEARLANAPPGLDDPYGNVEDVPIVTIVPTASASRWLVYEGARLSGLLELAPNEARGVYTQDLYGKGVKIQVTASPDRLVFDLPKKGLLFGGNDRQSTTKVTLERPSLEWLGSAVDSSDPWWSGNQVTYVDIPFRAFDITRMDPIYAYQGRTGCARRIFAKPPKNKFLLNSNKKVVPATHFYCPVDKAYGSTKTKLAQNEREFVTAYATHKGTRTDASTYSVDESSHSRWQQLNKGSRSRFVAITRSMAKKFALVLNPNQAQLDPQFVEACHELAESVASAEGDPSLACHDFIQTWGTHFAMGSVFGGMMVQNRVVTEGDVQSSFVSTTGGDRRKWAGLPEGIGVGMYTVNAGKAGREESFGWENNRGSSTGQKWSRENVSYFVVPGDQLSPGEATAATITDPVPLFFDLRPLHELLTPANFDDPFLYHDVRLALRKATKAYVNKTVVEPGQGMKPWLADLGRVEPRARIVSARAETHLEGVLSYERWGNGRSRRAVRFKALRRDELNHQMWAREHKTSRGKEWRPVPMDRRFTSWLGLGVHTRRELQQDPRRKMMRSWFEGILWVMPFENRWLPLTPQPRRIPIDSWPPPLRKGVVLLLDHQADRNSRMRVGTLEYRDFPSPGKRTRLKRVFSAPVPRGTKTSALYQKRFWIPAPQVEVEFELETRIIKDKVQPPELSSVELRAYAEHVAKLGALGAPKDPRDAIRVRRVADGQLLACPPGKEAGRLDARWVSEDVGLNRVPSRERDTFDKACARAAAGEGPLRDEAARLQQELQENGISRGAFYLQFGQRVLGISDALDDAQTVRVPVSWVQKGVGLPLPLRLVDGNLVSAVGNGDSPLRLCEEQGQLYWSRWDPGVRVELEEFGVVADGGAAK